MAATACNLVPLPCQIEARTGSFVLASAAIVAPLALLPSAKFLSVLTRAPIPSSPTAGNIVFQVAGELGPEGYSLSITPAHVDIRAATDIGAFYAVQTLKQLLADDSTRWPAMEITDQPRFPWRGLMLDPAREFLTVEFVERYIDLMASLKLNRLHLHLVDDQAWTVEIDRYPQLAGAHDRLWKDQERVRGTYSQADIRRLVAYAAERHITIIPEIEMPAHAVAALEAMPELLCPNNAWRTGERKWTDLPEGEAEFCIGSDFTFEFLRNVLAEITTLFPSKEIHIGGDEYYGIAWAKCPLCQQRAEKLRAKDTPDVAARFTKAKGHPKKFILYQDCMQRAAQIVHDLGRTPMLWDDMSWNGKYPSGTLVQQWHYAGGHDYWQNISTPRDPGVEAAENGHNVVVSSFSHLYFDYALADIPLRKVYEFEPLGPTLSPEARGTFWELKPRYGTSGPKTSIRWPFPELWQWRSVPGRQPIRAIGRTFIVG